MLDNLLFLPLDIPKPPDIVKELDNISYEEMTPDTYRNCYHIPIMRYNKKTDESKWIFKFTGLQDYLETHIFPWSQKARIVIITTKPKEKNHPHIDCSPDKFYTLQHKFRFVFQGNTSDLEFISNEKKLRVPDLNQPFIMDGKWPHEMTNNTYKRKYTLALGAPWEPKKTDEKYTSLINKSYAKYKDYYISSEYLNLPDNYQNLYEDIYKT